MSSAVIEAPRPVAPDTGYLPPTYQRPAMGEEAGTGIDEIKSKGPVMQVNARTLYEMAPNDFGYVQLEKSPAGQIEALSDKTEPVDLTPNTFNALAALDVLTHVPSTNQGKSVQNPTPPPMSHLGKTGNQTPIQEPRRASVNIMHAIAQMNPPKSSMGLSVYVDPIEVNVRPVETTKIDKVVEIYNHQAQAMLAIAA